MNKVNILYCFDTESWEITAVSIESLLSSMKPSTQMTIYCMVVPGTKGRRKINRIIKSHKTGVNLIWREITPCENPFQQHPEYSKLPVAAFYRCIAHRIFKDIDKMLYLGTNTLVFQDLTELFNTDVSDYAFGAVPDMAPINDANNVLGQCIKTFSNSYLNGGAYYNIGVLLLNLKKMAEFEHLLFETKIQLRYPVQDLLNASLVGKIKTLPLKYNLAPGVGVPSHFSEEEKNDVNSGGHVIIDCYYAKPYDKQHSNSIVYDKFFKCAKHVGINPERFEKVEVKKTFIPHITVRQGKILFFGMKVED